jgi:hypothetical protein
MPEVSTEGKAKLKTGFQNLMSKIGDVIEDLASLEVTTFTGDFSFKTKQIVQSDVNKFRINSVLKGMAVQNQTDIKAHRLYQCQDRLGCIDDCQK